MRVQPFLLGIFTSMVTWEARAKATKALVSVAEGRSRRLLPKYRVWRRRSGEGVKQMRKRNGVNFQPQRQRGNDKLTVKQKRRETEQRRRRDRCRKQGYKGTETKLTRMWECGR
jgi:V8-like Glu-specific endopeptidase